MEDSTKALHEESSFLDDVAIALMFFADEPSIENQEIDYASSVQTVPGNIQTPTPNITVAKKSRRAKSAEPAVRLQNRPDHIPDICHDSGTQIPVMLDRYPNSFARRLKHEPSAVTQPMLLSRNRSNRTIKTSTHDCVICQSVILDNPIRVPCGHYYDLACLLELVEASTRDESLFPPRCCQHRIPTILFEADISPALSTLLSEKELEFATRKRVYCANTSCNHFLGPHSTKAFPYIYTCTYSSCSTRTCSRCRAEVTQKKFLHTCRVDPSTKELYTLSRKAGWTQCPGCDRIIELRSGCNHVTCICKTQFCYMCSTPWKQCSCPRWDESRLVLEAQDVNRIGLPTYYDRMRLHAIRNTAQDREDNRPTRPITPEPWLLRSRAGVPGGALDARREPHTLRTTAQTNAYSRPNAHHRSKSQGIPTKPFSPNGDIKGDEGVTELKRSNTDSGTAPTSRRGRKSAPAVLQARESVLARGTHAQERRTRNRVELSARFVEDTAVESSPPVFDSVLLDVLEEQIDRLLRDVENHICKHVWQSHEGRHACDSCYRIGNVLSSCTQCAARTCARCRVNRV